MATITAAWRYATRKPLHSSCNRYSLRLGRWRARRRTTIAIYPVLLLGDDWHLLVIVEDRQLLRR